jgi:polyhydroxyalkanoate synthesis regulator phasin
VTVAPSASSLKELGMHKVLAGSLVVAGLAAGSLGVAALNPLGVATATVGSATQTTDPSSTTAPPPGDHQGPLGEVLDDLVSKGTITQAQADAVQNGVDAKHQEHGPGPRGGFGRGGAVKEQFTAVAQQLGMDPQDLLTELRSGKSLADVAKAKGVDPQTIIDSLVTAANAKIDDAVKNGKLDQAKADEMKQKLPDHIKDLVNHQGFEGKGPGPDAAPAQPAD